jgi:hypothetical protein
MHWVWLVGSAWALLPWMFWAVYQHHKPDHADVFWLPAMPLVFLSFIPLLAAYGGDTSHDNWFPVGWVLVCSVFNLIAYPLTLLLIRFWSNKP